MNTHPWWPNILQRANGPLGLGPDVDDPDALSSGSQVGSPRRRKSEKSEKSSPQRAVSAPLPVFVAPRPLTVSPHPKTAALRKHHEHLLRGSHLTVGDNAGRGERHDHDLHYSAFHKTTDEFHDRRPAQRLLYDLPHADQGGDREFTYDIGSVTGPSTLMLDATCVV